MSMWQRFLAESIQDPAQIRDLREFMGWCLSGGGEYGKALVLQGSYRESTLALQVLAALTREPAHLLPASLLSCSRFDFTQLLNRRVLFLDDLPTIPVFKGLVHQLPLFTRRPDLPRPVGRLVILPDMPLRAEPSVEARLLRVAFNADQSLSPQLTCEECLNEREDLATWARGGLQDLQRRGGFAPRTHVEASAQ